MKRGLALAGVLLAGGLLTGTFLRSPEHAKPSAVTAATTVSSPSTIPSPVVHEAEPARPQAGSSTVASPSADRPNPTADVKTALAMGDDHDLVVAVEAAVEARAVDALPALSSIDLRTVPHSAPAVIGAIASLAQEAGPRERREAATTLSRWFREERSREGADAAGNTTMLIDALADTNHREAADALVAALDEHKLPLNNETLIVQRLADLRQTSAKPGIVRFQARVAALPKAEDLDEELRTEALVAAREALAQLGG